MRLCRTILLIALCVAVPFISGCKGGQKTGAVVVNTGGSAHLGKQIIVAYKCGQCHNIPGVPGAHGVFGPPLIGVARITYIAGNFPNTPENLEHWIVSPKAMKPHTAMPTLGLDEQQARDVAAYLYTLR